jgi:hypothetical protein
MGRGSDVAREMVEEAGPMLTSLGLGGSAGWWIASATSHGAAHVPAWSGWSIGGLLVAALGIAVWGIGKAIKKPPPASNVFNFGPGSSAYFGQPGASGASVAAQPLATGIPGVAGSGTGTTTFVGTAAGKVVLPREQDGDSEDQ